MARTETHECRNCGAPLGIPTEHDRFFRCASCGSVLEDVTPPEAKAAGRIEISIAQHPTVDVSTLQAYAKPAKVLGGAIIAVLAVGFFGLVGVAVAIASFAGSFGSSTSGGTTSTVDASSMQIYNYAVATVVASDDSTGRDVVAIARTDDDSQLLYLDLDAESPIRWAAARSSESDVFTQFLTAGDVVVVSSGAGLDAYNRTSGAEAWSTDLSDVLEPNICTECFRLFGDSIVTLTADGVLSARSVATGEQQWSSTLTETPRQILDFGGSPAVLDTTDGVTQLHVFSLADGTVTERVPLSCPDTTFGGRSAVNIYDTLFSGPDGSLLYVADPSFGGCVQVWAPGSGGTPRLEFAYAYPNPSGATEDHVRVFSNRALIADGAVVDLIDMGIAQPRRLAELPESELFPIGLTETAAVVAAKSTRGTARWSIVALDLATGAEKWRFELEAEESLIDGRSFSVGNAWTASVTSAGVSVAQYRDEAVELVVQTIPIDSGTASSPVVTDLSGRGITDSLSVSGWFDDDLLLAMNGSMIVIDGTTGAVRTEGP